MSNKNVLDGLNEDQKAPVIDFTGPCLIVAGPGSGKTFTIVSRTRNMLEHGINPSSVILFTFTSKAANEIKERVKKSMGKKAELLTVGTYHSICARFLRKHAECVGFTKNFTIYDNDDTMNTIKRLTLGLELEPKVVRMYISDCKNKMWPPTMAMQEAKTSMEKASAEIYRRYQSELVSQNAMDFDDLIYYMIILLERNHDVLTQINNQYRYIIADEFHDSSKRDIRFIELLSGEAKNICLILDDEQSIYGFRGADLKSVLSVQDLFPEMKRFVLRQNYRSTQTIVKASRSLIKNNIYQLEKELFSENSVGTKIVYSEEESYEAEAIKAVKFIKFLMNDKGVEPKDIAILYRTSMQSRVFEQTMLQNNIPYVLRGGLAFYSRKEIKDILCYARLIFNPSDFEAFKRAVNTPKRGVGEAAIQKIYEQSLEPGNEHLTFIDIAKTITLKGKAAHGIEQFNAIIDVLTEAMYTHTPDEFIGEILSMTNYAAHLQDEENSLLEAQTRWENIEELQNLASTFDTMEEFFENLSLNSQIDNDHVTEGVNLQTMHTSKGLEYRAVIIVGANEQTCPHYKASTVHEIEEERRLFYVAMTRAKEYLFILRPKVVIQRGRRVWASESRFIKEIDSKYIVKI